MANDISQWFVADASNNTGSAPDYPVEGQSPSSVNDTMRTIFGAVARWYNDTNASLTSTGSSNAYILATNHSHSTLADQSLLVFIANHANTGAATLNVDSLGAKAIERGGAALSGGEIVADHVVIVAYNGTDDVYDLVSGALPTKLADLSGLAVTDGNFIVGDGSTFVAESGATARASMGANDASNLTTGSLADGRVQQSNVTQHQSALAINSSQVTSTIKNENAGFSVGSDDAGDVVEIDSSSNRTVTVGSNALGGAGNMVLVLRRGTGTVTFSASGTTIRTKGGLSILQQNGAAALIQLASTEFQLVGDI